jgi:hypothetical protein
MLKQWWINGVSVSFSVGYKQVGSGGENVWVGEAMAIQVRAKEMVKVGPLNLYFHV